MFLINIKHGLLLLTTLPGHTCIWTVYMYTNVRVPNKIPEGGRAPNPSSQGEIFLNWFQKVPIYVTLKDK